MEILNDTQDNKLDNRLTMKAITLDQNDYMCEHEIVGSHFCLSSSGRYLAVRIKTDTIPRPMYVIELFERDLNGNWYRASSIYGEQSGSCDFGKTFMFSADETTLLIADTYVNAAQEQHGVVHVYEGNNCWRNVVRIAAIENVFIGSLTKYISNDYFGCSLGASADGKIVVIGSMYDALDQVLDDDLTGIGSAHIYTRGRYGYNFRQTLCPIERRENLHFGYNLTVSPDGRYIAVSAKLSLLGEENNNEGSVYLFELDNDRWLWYLSEVKTAKGSYDTLGESYGEKLLIDTNNRLFISGKDNVGDIDHDLLRIYCYDLNSFNNAIIHDHQLIRAKAHDVSSILSFQFAVIYNQLLLVSAIAGANYNDQNNTTIYLQSNQFNLSKPHVPGTAKVLTVIEQTREIETAHPSLSLTVNQHGEAILAIGNETNLLTSSFKI